MDKEENIFLNIINRSNNKEGILLEILNFIIKFIAHAGAGLVFMYILFNYIYNIYFLSYWKIDNIFNVSNSYINSLLYDLLIIIILIIVIIPLIEKTSFFKKMKLFICFFVIVSITGKNIAFSLSYFFVSFIISIVGYFCCLLIGRKIRKEIQRNENDIINKIYNIRKNISKVVVIPISIFISVVIIALVTAYCQTEYRVINKDGKISQVVLYSTKDYYIVADCEEENNILKVNNNIQQKISTENVEIEIIKFDKVEKAK